MQLLKEELHPPRHELEEGPTLRLLSETLTSTLSLFSNYNSGSALLLQYTSLVSFGVRNGLLFIGKETWECGAPPLLLREDSLFSRAQSTFPWHCSMQGNVLEAVEVKTGQEPDPRGSNRA
jgi:hypothetical protein